MTIEECDLGFALTGVLGPEIRYLADVFGSWAGERKNDLNLFLDFIEVSRIIYDPYERQY